MGSSQPSGVDCHDITSFFTTPLSAYGMDCSDFSLFGYAWRLIETSYNTVYATGTVNTTTCIPDRPTGLGPCFGITNPPPEAILCVDAPGDPDPVGDISFCSSFYYTGYMELQIGCVDLDTGAITWPDP